MMAITENTAFADRIDQACDRLGLTCSDEQRARLLGYIVAMARWNKTYNLTALREPSQMLVQHVFDSLAPLPDLFNTVAGPQDRISVCDIGSGGGLPGVIIAIMAPAWQVKCVDAVSKKTAFVQQMIGTLTLPNLGAIHTRVEALAPQGADIVISRAFASLLDFATLSGEHVSPDGHLVAMKGKTPDDEIEILHAQTDWRVQRVQALEVPELNAQRCLLWMRRNKGNP